MGHVASRHAASVGRAMMREIAYAPDVAAVRRVLREYLNGPSREDAIQFLGAYLCRTAAGFLPDPDRLDP